MDIVERCSQIACERLATTHIRELVAQWKERGLLQAVALHREWATAQIALTPEIATCLSQELVTIEQLSTWLADAIRQEGSQA